MSFWEEPWSKKLTPMVDDGKFSVMRCSAEPMHAKKVLLGIFFGKVSSGLSQCEQNAS
jgi:hypothetical protein